MFFCIQTKICVHSRFLTKTCWVYPWGQNICVECISILKKHLQSLFFGKIWDPHCLHSCLCYQRSKTPQATFKVPRQQKSSRKFCDMLGTAHCLRRKTSFLVLTDTVVPCLIWNTVYEFIFGLLLSNIYSLFELWSKDTVQNSFYNCHTSSASTS